MKDNKMNGYIVSGLFLYALVFGVGRFVEIPEFLKGVGIGLSITLELYGAYALNHDTSKIKDFKRNIYRKIMRKVN